jgi:hypothetical protein
MSAEYGNVEEIEWTAQLRSDQVTIRLDSRGSPLLSREECSPHLCRAPGIVMRGWCRQWAVPKRCQTEWTEAALKGNAFLENPC